jgi:peptidoglycan/xylan/chitin deacetylase (PgdA/CDA1 family)
LDAIRYPYVPIVRRPALAWPDGARIAFYVALNIEYFALDTPFTRYPNVERADVPFYTLRDYGNRVGVFRIMDILDKHNVRASALLNSDVCREYPAIIEEGRVRNWEWLGHGITNHYRLIDYPEDQERAVIHEVSATIEAATGVRPRGWLGPGLAETLHTPDYLAAEGFDYVCDWGGDDQPIPMRVEAGRMVAVPYQQGLNDMALLYGSSYTGPDYLQAIRDQFDVLYAEGASGGRVFALPIHTFAAGLAHHSKYLDQAIEYIVSHEGVWVTTAGDIASWYYDHHDEWTA